MRAVPLLVFALLVGAIAATDAEAMQREFNAAAKAAGARLGSIAFGHPAALSQVPSAASLAHVFAAQQAATTSTCNQQQFADATARVLQACPSLSGLVSGSTAPEEFLPGFCGSECYNVLATELTANIGCLDGTTMFLLAFVRTCQVRPQCYSEAFVGGGARLQRECGHQLASPMQMNNFTDAAIRDARAACSGTCLTRQIALMRQFPECVRDGQTDEPMPVTALTGFMEALCSQENEEYCAVTLKAFGKMDCTQCSRSGSWCTATCDSPSLTTERLNQLCSPCTSKLLRFLPAVGAQAGQLAGAVGTFCMTAKGGMANETNPYCYPLALTTMASAYASGSPTNATVATSCAGDFTPRCVDRTLASLSAMSIDAAYKSFDYCFMSYSVSFCQSRLESALRAAESMRVQGSLLCGRNANGDYCLPHALTLATALGMGSCSSLATAVPAAGCCLPAINDFMRLQNPNAPASYLPSGKRTINVTFGTQKYSAAFTSTALYSMPSIDRSLQPVNAIPALCSSSVPNSSTFWEQAETPCAPRTPLANLSRAALPLPLAWVVLSRDHGLMQRVKRSLRADFAGAMGVPLRAIVNDTLVEDTRNQVTLRAAATATRQTTGMASATMYVFSVDAESPAESQAAVARLNTAMAAKTMTTSNTAATVEAECEECIDARTTSLAQATTAMETPAPPPSPSSASSVAIGAAAVAALLVLVL